MTEKRAPQEFLGTNLMLHRVTTFRGSLVHIFKAKLRRRDHGDNCTGSLLEYFAPEVPVGGGAALHAHFDALQVRYGFAMQDGSEVIKKNAAILRCTEIEQTSIQALPYT